MKTAWKYIINDFRELEKPEFMKGCEREMIYRGTVIDKDKKKHIVHWDKNGKCANLMFNDFFIAPYDLINYLNEKIKNNVKTRY